LADSVARLVSAATVEAVFAEALLVLADVLAGVAEAWLLLMLPIDIIAPMATAGIRGIGRNSKNLSTSTQAGLLVGGLEQSGEIGQGAFDVVPRIA